MPIHFSKDRLLEVRDAYERWWNGTLDRPLMNILPAELEEIATILYVAGETYTPAFKSAPPKDLWPASAK